MHFKIKPVETDEEFKHYYHLRWQLLRAPWHQPEGSEIDDIEDQCFHVIAITNEQKVIGVARLQFNSDDTAQIRYMAVDKAYQRQGIGRQLINAMEQHAVKTRHIKIILDAREPAVNFYKKLDYQILKKSYLLFDEIQHYQMTKSLS